MSGSVEKIVYFLEEITKFSDFLTHNKTTDIAYREKGLTYYDNRFSVRNEKWNDLTISWE